jgi:hypothetical protein
MLMPDSPRNSFAAQSRTAAAATALEPAVAAHLHGSAAIEAPRTGTDHTGARTYGGVSPSSPRR